MLVSQGAPSISGFSQEVKIDKNLEPGLRVTVRLDQKQLPGVYNSLIICLVCRPISPSLFHASSFFSLPREQNLPGQSRVFRGPSH